MFSDLVFQKHFGEFTIKRFESTQDFENYMGLKNYGFDPDTPGVCFGF